MYEKLYLTLPYLTSAMCLNFSLLWFVGNQPFFEGKALGTRLVGNKTSPDHQLCIKTMYQARNKEIVEVSWCINL